MTIKVKPLKLFQRMILILSTPTDYDSQCVIEWLRNYNVPFFRLNDEDIMQGKTKLQYSLGNTDPYFVKDEQKIRLSDITVVWFRKFGFLRSYEENIGKNNDLIKYVYSEFSHLRTILFSFLDQKKWLYYKPTFSSKIEILQKAHQCGISVPKTIITTSLQDLKSFFEKCNNSIITKSIGEAKKIEWNSKYFPFHTHKIENISKLSNHFSPSLFQEYIEKEYEIRTFFLDNNFYSMAIFSQRNPLTKIDFRTFDPKKPNRYVPYKLPNTVEEKLKRLFNSIKLNTGSIDLIKCSKNGKYYFLEINPAGQFGMTSFPCNYGLHKKVAHYLKKENECLIS